MRRLRLLWLTGALVVCVATVFGISAANGQTTVQHGIGFTKGCVSPTKIGDPYQCSYTIRNILDEAGDTLTINGLVDVVHSAGGDVSSGNIIGAVQITVEGGATCVATGGNGSVATPYTGV